MPGKGAKPRPLQIQGRKAAVKLSASGSISPVRKLNQNNEENFIVAVLGAATGAGPHFADSPTTAFQLLPDD